MSSPLFTVQEYDKIEETFSYMKGYSTGGFYHRDRDTIVLVYEKASTLDFLTPKEKESALSQLKYWREYDKGGPDEEKVKFARRVFKRLLEKAAVVLSPQDKTLLENWTKYLQERQSDVLDPQCKEYVSTIMEKLKEFPVVLSQEERDHFLEFEAKYWERKKGEEPNTAAHPIRVDFAQMILEKLCEKYAPKPKHRIVELEHAVKAISSFVVTNQQLFRSFLKDNEVELSADQFSLAIKKVEKNPVRELTSILLQVQKEKQNAKNSKSPHRTSLDAWK